ncbi:bacteriocin [Aquimarina sp. 2304DJ70-9]|uniref:bacteriocin n=1 Tax=Aquimarina penaris TaxID=3231044 RepID=UPI0034627671
MKILNKNQLKTINGGSGHGVGGGTGETRRREISSWWINLDEVRAAHSGHGIGDGTGQRPR